MKMQLTPAIAFVLLMVVLPLYGQQEEQEPIPVPINAPKAESGEETSRAVRSFSNTVAWNVRNPFGFSLGVSEGRISSVFPNSLESHPSMLTAFSGSAFANFGRRKSRLHMDYSGGYRIYNLQREMDGADHYGNITYTYHANRKVRFELSDMVSSSLNDPFSSIGPSLRTTIDWSPSPSYSVVFMPQRLTQNQARGQIDIDFTQSTHFSVFGAYELYRYGRQEYADIDAVQVGVGFDQRVTNWLFLSSSYSTYLNNVDERLRDYQIHRLEMGRFRFVLAPNFEIFASGGIEVADNRGDFRTAGMFRGGISRSSEKNAIYANYQRTMTSALGYSRVLPSNMVTLGFGQRLTTRTNLRLSGSYMRSSDFEYSGLLNGLYAKAQFEYALRSDLFASLNYAFQHQKNTIGVFQNIPQFNRSVVSLSLQYTWPSIRLLSE